MLVSCPGNTRISVQALFYAVRKRWTLPTKCIGPSLAQDDKLDLWQKFVGYDTSSAPKEAAVPLGK